MSQSRERFSRYHEHFKSVRGQMILPPHVSEAILGVVRGRVLDIGTADGYKLHWILEKSEGKVSNVVALEPSPRLFKQAEKEFLMFPNSEVVHCSFEEFEPNEVFDTVFLFEVIEHIPKCLHHQAMVKCVSLLAQGGTLVISTPNRPVYRFKCWLSGEKADPTHVSEFDLHELRAFLSGYFRQIHYYGSLPWMRLLRRFPILTQVNAVFNPLRISHVFYALLSEPHEEIRCENPPSHL